MFRSILAIFAAAMVFAIPTAQAQPTPNNDAITLEGLPDRDKADIIGRANRAREELLRRGAAAKETVKDTAEAAKSVPQVAKDISKGTREEVEAWGLLGAGAGKALVAAAKELGMAGNEFAHTGLGKIVIAIIAVKLVGKSFVGISFGIGIMIVFYRWGYRIMRPVESVEYALTPVLWGAFSRKRIVKQTMAKVSSDQQVLGALMIAITTVAAAVAIFTST